MTMVTDRKSGQKVSGRAILRDLITLTLKAALRSIQYRRTVRALRRLDDRGLRDIGLTRTSEGYRLAPDELGRKRRPQD
ncbi:DUF1127 domain-containing protein [Roseibium algae]|uniref:DUF1127 domain-containing protein n=1 Tax=Roseibium algae TaxID=3123038 RepID=A0ABU8TQT2_9HYPH